MAIFTILILPNHEHGMFLHLFVCFLISLSSGLQFSLRNFFTFFVSCIPRYSIVFVAIVNGSSFLIWLSLSLLLVYRNACVFCTLILYPETLLKLLISYRRFWAETMGSSKYTIMSSANRDNLTSSFPNQICFTSFSCLIALVIASNTMLNKCCESSSLPSARFQRECFQFLSLQYDIGCGFLINSFYYFEIHFIDTQFIEGFQHKELLNFVKGLVCIY